MPVLHIPTRTHGRVVLEEATTAAAGVLVIFHGYGQSADDALADAMQISGISNWRVAAVQGLHRFYSRRHEQVVASWMTRQDRELAIADNIAYLDEVLKELSPSREAVVFAGFSQGASMAYRAAQLCERTAAGVLAVAGDVPPDVADQPARAWPPVFIGAGDQDPWFTAAKLEADVAHLQRAGAGVEVCRFSGGHEWTAELRTAAGAWLDRRRA